MTTLSNDIQISALLATDSVWKCNCGISPFEGVRNERMYPMNVVVFEITLPGAGTIILRTFHVGVAIFHLHLICVTNIAY